MRLLKEQETRQLTPVELMKLFGEDWRDYMPPSYHVRRWWSIYGWPFAALVGVAAVLILALLLVVWT